MKRVKVTQNTEINSIVEFSQTNPWRPQYSSDMVRRFLTELVSSQEFIFDIHDDQGRLASAVLLDKVNNPANDACLEILGLRSDVEASLVLSKILSLAEAAVPKHRSGFQIGLSETSELKAVLSRYGLKDYYDTYEMKLEIGETTITPKEIVDAVEANRDEIYDVLCQSFINNPDTSIPEAGTWKAGFLKSPASHFYLWKTNERILGFANLVEDGGVAEIRTIGVLPGSRGLGIGNKLLKHCIYRSKLLGKKSCYLTVAVQNENALGLYLRAGFKVIHKLKCYRKSV